jgi:uncharacterized protein (TIGR02996 family)
VGGEAVNADSEQNALLEAIFATPDDDTPRLVYADWLDEHGEPEYAEFIRLQIECAKQPNPVLRKPLVRGERVVWKKLKRKWRDLFAPPTIVRKDDFHRGFISGSAAGMCRIPVDRFIARSEHLWPRVPIRCVQLTLPPTSSEFPMALFDCASLRRLVRLEFSRQYLRCLNEEFVIQLFSCGLFERLLELEVADVPLSRSVVQALRTSPYLSRLRRLNVQYTSIKNGERYYDWLIFPSGAAHPEQSGAGAMLAKVLPKLEPYFVVVPPGETAHTAIIEHTRRVRTA